MRRPDHAAALRRAAAVPAPVLARVLAPVAALIVAAASCGGAPEAPAGPPPDRVLRLSFLQDPGQPPDPDVFYAGQGLLLTTNMYEGLLRYAGGSAEPKIEGVLASEWEASEDNKTFTFELRKGVKFHDGTPFTADAVKASFDRRLAVDKGPAYMVAGVDSVTTEGDHKVTIELKEANAAFPGYLASAYGPKMLSPTAIEKHGGSDDLQTYLRTHDAGTGPYTLTDAKVGSRYAMRAFDGYWGEKPYFTSVDMPVISDAATQQLKLDRGELAAIMHGLPSSAVKQYRESSAVKSYSLPTMQNQMVYVNPGKGFLTSAANRTKLLQAIDVDTMVKQVFTGRGRKSAQAYPKNMLPAGMAAQNVRHDPQPLRTLAGSRPAAQKSITVGYDSSSSDLQTLANLVAAQLTPLGLQVKVQAYPTSQIYGWVDDPKGAPDLLMAGGWPDAAPPYTWAHIVWHPEGGLNYLHCEVPGIEKMLADGEHSGDERTFSRIGELSTASGCWLNVVDEDDFVVAQPWLRGVDQAHIVTEPNTLNIADLSAE